MASCVLALMVLAVAAIFFFVDAEKLKETVVSQLESQLKRNVTAGKAEVTIFTGLGARVHNLTIGEDPRFGATPFARLGSVQVRLKLLPLLTGNVVVDSVQVDEPVIRLIKKPTGAWNFESLARSRETSPPAATSSAKASQSTQGVAVDALRISEGAVWIRDESRAPSNQESQYQHIFLELNGVSTDQAGNFSLRLTLPGSGSDSLEVAGKLGPLDLSNFSKVPLDATIHLADVPLASLAGLASSQPSPIEWKGHITTQTHIQGSAGQVLTVEGETNVSGLGTKQLGLESPEISGKLEHRLTYQASSGSLEVQRSTLQLPASELSLQGSVKRDGEESSLDLKVDSSRLAVDDALKLAAAVGAGAPKGMQASGQIVLQLQVAGKGKNPNLSGQAKLLGGEVIYPGLDRRIVLSPLSLTFDKARFSSSLMEVAVGQRTRVQAQITGDLSTPKLLTTRLNTPSAVQVADLLAIGSTFGVRLPEGVTIQNGTLSLQAEARTPLEGRDGTQIIGKAAIAGSQVKLPWLTQPLNISRADLELKGDSISVTALALRLAESAVTGRAKLSNLTTPALQFSLNVDQVDLATLSTLVASSPAASPANTRAFLMNEPLLRGLAGAFGTPPVFAAPPKPSAADPLAALTVLPSQVSVGRVRYDTLRLENVSSNLQMKNNVLNLGALQFQMHRGTHSGRASFDLNGAQPNYTFNSALKNVDANEFLTQNSSLKNLIYGQFSSDLDIKGTGNGFDAITRSLKGGGKATLTKGRITSFNLLEQVAAIGKLAGLNFKQGGSTDIEDMISNFRIEDGRVFADMMHVRVPGASLKASGSFGFDNTIDYQLSVELPAQSAGAATPFLNLATATFFRSEQGKIVVPLRLSGKVERPGFALDSRVVRDNLSRTGKEAAKGALDALQNAFSGKKADNQSGAAAEDGNPEKAAAERAPEKKASPLDRFQDLLNKAKEKKKAKEN